MLALPVILVNLEKTVRMATQAQLETRVSLEHQQTVIKVILALLVKTVTQAQMARRELLEILVRLESPVNLA